MTSPKIKARRRVQKRRERDRVCRWPRDGQVIPMSVIKSLYAPAFAERYLQMSEALKRHARQVGAKGR